MTPLLSLVILSVFAYLGSAILRKFRHSISWLENLNYSGSLFLILGILIGPSVLQILNTAIIHNLNVLVGLVLGWSGFLVGLQFKFSELKRFQSSYFFFSITNYLIMQVLLFAVIVATGSLLDHVFETTDLVILAIIGAVSSPIMIGLLKRKYKLRGQLVHLLQFSVAFDTIPAIILFGVLMILFNYNFQFSDVSIILILLSLTINIAAGYLFYLLTKELRNQQQYFLILLGLLILQVGIAITFNLSVLFSAFVFGTMLTNLPINTRKLYQSIADAERPLYFLMLIFIGARINEFSWLLIAFAFTFVLGRTLLKMTAVFITAKPFRDHELNIGISGLAHLGMGGISLAFALDYNLGNTTAFADHILFFVSASVIINEIITLLISNKVVR
jgi:Kef-type K+ transport system membrane component KefB